MFIGLFLIFPFFPPFFISSRRSRHRLHMGHIIQRAWQELHVQNCARLQAGRHHRRDDTETDGEHGPLTQPAATMRGRVQGHLRPQSLRL